jgi:RNA polymerase sigma factor (sigma-70 family)
MPDLKLTYELITKKDRESVRVLYERYGKKLFSYARRKWKIGDDDNWELVYKTLYRVIETHASYTFAGEEKFATFVFTIFINYLRNFFRDRKKLPEEITLLDEAFSSRQGNDDEDAPSPAMQLLADELDQLEDWERILLLMRSQEIPYSKIAEFTSKPEEHLKVYYQRLKKKLAARLHDKFNSTDRQP